MKIGLLSFEYPPDTGFGGIGSYTWYHARALARMGHEVHVVAGATRPCELETSAQDGVSVHRFRSDGLLMKSFRGLGRYRCYWSQNRLENALSMAAALNRLRRRHRFDVLEMPECGAEGLLLPAMLNIPTVVRFHSPSRLIMPFYDVPAADHKMCSALEQVAIRRATSLTSCSGFLADEVRSKMGVSAPVTVIPNGIDLDLFDREPLLDVVDKFNLPPNKPIILFAARMEQRKGIHLCGEIAQAILEKYDVALVFAGQDLFGYMTNTLLPALSGQRLIGSVHYVGKLDLETVRSCVRSADIYLLPSLWENCPYSCLEAMAAGRAIVSSDQGGMPELIRDGYNGLLARSGEAGSYVEKLSRLIEDLPLRRRLGAAARESVERCYTDDRIARLSGKVYERCVNGARGVQAVPV